MLHLNSQGYIFNEHSDKDPIVDLQWLLTAESTSFNSFERCLESGPESLQQVSATCRDLHAVNISLLKQRLVDMGSEPTQTVDFWQSLSGLINTTAAIIGEEALLAAFRKHEFDLFEEYENKLQAFDGDNLVLVQQKLIPNQLRVCELLGAIRSDGAELVSGAALPADFSPA